MRMRIILGLWIALFSCVPAVAAEGGWAVAGKASTLGFGADLHRVLVPGWLSFRTGFGSFRYSIDISDNNINYHARLKLGAVPIGIDVYPFKNWFRLNGGLMINLNEVDASATPNALGQITINGTRYTVAQIGQLDAAVKFDRASPFVGLGFGRPFKNGKHWGFMFDLGAMYHGQAKLSLSTTTPPSSQLQNDLRQQEQRFNQDAKNYPWYPIIQFGLSYRFGATR